MYIYPLYNESEMQAAHPANLHFTDWATEVVNYAHVKAQVLPLSYYYLLIFADSGRGGYDSASTRL